MGLINLVKLPEPFIYAIDLDVRGSSAAFLVRDKTFQSDHRTDGAKVSGEAALRL